jgi:hypothetical protein
MKDQKYLVTDNWERFCFCETKEEAADKAEEMLGCTDDMIYIFEVKHIGNVFIPDPDPVIEWKED